MGYADMVAITQSQSLGARIRMCAVQQIDATLNPEWWVGCHIDRLAALPGWGDAFASARANGVADPGADEAVITDGMILSAVQTLMHEDLAAAEQKANEAKVAAAAAEKARKAADAELQQQARDEEEWRMRTQAQITAATLAPAVQDVEPPPAPTKTTTTAKTTRKATA